MTDQEILDNAPLPDWTHHNDDIDSDVACFYSYIKQVEGINGQGFYKLGFDGKRKVWKQCAGIYNTTRSRIDIERIAELEKERNSLLRLISYVKSIVFSKVKCSYVSFKRPLEELLKD